MNIWSAMVAPLSKNCKKFLQLFNYSINLHKCQKQVVYKKRQKNTKCMLTNDIYYAKMKILCKMIKTQK